VAASPARRSTAEACVPFRFVLLRAPDDTDPRAAVGVVCRARAHGEHVWVMSLTPKAASHRSVAMLLALLTVDQALLILPSQDHPRTPRARAPPPGRHPA
jgi:hypothetical protein